MYFFRFLNTIFKSILHISRTQFSRRMRDIVQLQSFLCHVTKNEVFVFGNLSGILALVKSKLTYGGI